MSGTITPNQPGAATSVAVTPAASQPVRQTKSAPGKLATSPVLKTCDEFVKVLAPLVCAGANVTDPTKTATLSAQLLAYFEALGITDEATLVVMLPDGFRDNKPASFSTTAVPLKLLTPVVILFVTKLTQVIQALNGEGLYLQSGTTFSCLAFWLDRLTHPGKIGAGVTVLGRGLSGNAGQPSKLPSFTVAVLKDDVVDITSYLDKVVQIFGDNGVSEFLTSEDVCRASPNFSKTFCSRLLGSVKNNVIHGHLFDEIKGIANCAMLWSSLKEKLRSSELSTSVMMNHWKTFFKLECDDVDKFLSYHNQLKKVLQKLKDCNSIAVGDDDFLRVFVHRALDIEELKESVKNLVKPVKDGSITFMEQLDAIRDDCISSTGSQGIQTAGTASALRSRRVDANASKRSDFTQAKGGHTHLNALPDLPKNMDNALNPYAFGQMRHWYLLVKKYPKTAEDQEELDSFKWKPDPQRKKQKTASSSGDRNTRRANKSPVGTETAPPATPAPTGDGGPPPQNVRFGPPPLPPHPHGNYGGYGSGGGWNPGYSNEMNARRAGHHPYYPPQHGGDYYPPQNNGGGGPGFNRAYDNNRQRFSHNRGNSQGHGGQGN